MVAKFLHLRQKLISSVLKTAFFSLEEQGHIFKQNSNVVLFLGKAVKFPWNSSKKTVTFSLKLRWEKLEDQDQDKQFYFGKKF